MLQHGFESDFLPNNKDLNWPEDLFIASYHKEHISFQECKQLLDIVSEFNFEPKIADWCFFSFFCSDLDFCSYLNIYLLRDFKKALCFWKFFI